MSQTAPKVSRLNIRCDTRTRELLDRAAGYTHVSVSEFVLSRAVTAAERIVQEQESITLNAEDFHDFLAALDAPGDPSPALRKAFERHGELIDRE